MDGAFSCDAFSEVILKAVIDYRGQEEFVEKQFERSLI
jgi:hypothetical protein